GPMPAANRQFANWTSTGASGREGLVPAEVAPRLSWTAPSPVCFDGDPIVDGAGDLVFAYHNLASGKSPGTVHLSFFPSDGAAGLDVSNAPNGFLETIAAPRPRGFYTSIPSFSPA